MVIVLFVSRAINLVINKNKKALETTLFLWFPPSMGDPYFFFNSSLWGEYGEAGREVNKPKACVIPSEAWESRSYYVAIRHLLQFVASPSFIHLDPHANYRLLRMTRPKESFGKPPPSAYASTPSKGGIAFYSPFFCGGLTFLRLF